MLCTGSAPSTPVAPRGSANASPRGLFSQVGGLGPLLQQSDLHDGLSPLARIQEVHTLLARATADRASRDHQVRLAIGVMVLT